MKYTVKLQGEIDHHSADKVRSQIDSEILKSGAGEITFDFSDVTFMDSSGIGVLLGRYKLFATRKIYISGAKDNIDKLLKMSGIYGIMPKKEDCINE